MTNFRCQGQLCTLLSSRTLFGREVCTVYLPESGRVLEIGHEDLACEDSNRVLTKDEIVAVASAGKVYEALNSYRQAFGEDVLLAPLDSAVTPLPHQLDTLKRAIERVPVRRIFADEVGLGKTIEAGLVIRELKLRGLVKRILIVAPTGLAKQWVAEMKTHFEEDFQLFLPSQVEAAGELLQAARLKLAVDPQAAENPYFFSDQVVCPLDAIKPMRRRLGWTKEQVEEYNAKRFPKSLKRLVSKGLEIEGWRLVSWRGQERLRPLEVSFEERERKQFQNESRAKKKYHDGNTKDRDSLGGRRTARRAAGNSQAPDGIGKTPTALKLTSRRSK